MNGRKSTVAAWVRTVHRWVSLGFIATVLAVLVDLLVGGSMQEPLSVVAVSGIALLLLTGGWMVTHHHTRRWRSRRRRSMAAVAAPEVAVESE